MRGLPHRSRAPRSARTHLTRPTLSKRPLILALGVLALLSAAPIATAGPPQPVTSAHFHHVHLNVTDPKTTIAFYGKFFGASEVRYRGLSDGLFTEKSYILLSRVTTPPPSNLGTSLWHIGWGGVDGESDFRWRTAAGIGVQTPIAPFGPEFYMYFWGPDREVIEIWTGARNHRFEHVHLLASDLGATLAWFENHLGLARGAPADFKVSGITSNYFRVDNVRLSIMQRPADGEPRPEWWPAEVGASFPPTDGTAIDHIAFSFDDVAPLLRRMRRSGEAIVRPLERSREYGLKSFFIRGPDGLLVEIVEEPAIPEGAWRTTR